MTGRDAARDELAKTIQAYGSRFGYTVDIHLADCIAGAVLHAGYRKMTVTPEQIEHAATAIDERIRDYTGPLSANQALGAAHVAAHAFGLSVAEDSGSDVP